tara:strand:- start:104 stop:313 length:210 start_codon:yes stop_codon:yes gene_type:complete
MFGEIVYPVSEKRYLYFGRTCVGVVLSMRHHDVGFFGHMFISSGYNFGPLRGRSGGWLAGAKITGHLAF